MITVRLATLADTAAITAIYKTDVPVWERLDPSGALISIPYEALSLFERWQHGGPWMSIETCAVHLSRLLAGSGIPLVAELNGEVLAEAEVYESFEPPPFGHHLNLSVIVAHADYLRQGLGTALMKYIVEMARLMKCERVTVSHAEAQGFYIKQGFRHTLSGRRVRIPTAPGRAFYQSTELMDHSPDTVKGWIMLLGRYQSSRQEWEKLFPQQWAAGIPELLEASAVHLKMMVAGQNAIVFLREAEEPGEVNLSCWSPRQLTNPLLTAIRDRANRDGFNTIVTYVMDSDLALLGSDVQATEHTQDLYELRLT